MVVQAVSTSYIVVCRGPNCRERGGLGLRRRLTALLKGEQRASLVGYNCFGQCDFGPNLAFYPEGAWYGGLIDADAAERAVKHATSGAPMRARRSSSGRSRRRNAGMTTRLLCSRGRYPLSLTTSPPPTA